MVFISFRSADPPRTKLFIRLLTLLNKREKQRPFPVENGMDAFMNFTLIVMLITCRLNREMMLFHSIGLNWQSSVPTQKRWYAKTPLLLISQQIKQMFNIWRKPEELDGKWKMKTITFWKQKVIIQSAIMVMAINFSRTPWWFLAHTFFGIYRYKI